MLNDDKLRERMRPLLITEDVSGFYEVAELLEPEYRNSVTVRRFVDLVRREDATPVGALLGAVVMLTRESADFSRQVVEHESRKTPHEIVTDHGTYRYTGPTAKEIELKAELARVREVAGEVVDKYADVKAMVIDDRSHMREAAHETLSKTIDDYRKHLGLTEGG